MNKKAPGGYPEAFYSIGYKKGNFSITLPFLLGTDLFLQPS